MKKLVWWGLLFCLLAPARANIAIVRVVGSSLVLMQSEAVEMVSEDIDIRALGKEQLGLVEYRCHFVLHSTSDEESHFQVGFPLDGPAVPDVKEPEKGVKAYQFTARDTSAGYQVTLLEAPAQAKHEYTEMFLWNMQLKPGETKDLWVEYRLGLSIGPHELRQNPVHELPVLTRIAKLEAGTDVGWGYWFGYTTSSGATWKGARIGHAKFTLHDKEFRTAMDALTELPALGTRAELAEEFGSFCSAGALPSSRVITEDGFCWEFHNFVPGPKIEYFYGISAIPSRPSELSVPSALCLEELKQARQLLVAAYGGAPKSKELAAQVQEQFWYRPDPNFRESALDADRKAVLAELDRRIAQVSKSTP